MLSYFAPLLSFSKTRKFWIMAAGFVIAVLEEAFGNSSVIVQSTALVLGLSGLYATPNIK